METIVLRLLIFLIGQSVLVLGGNCSIRFTHREPEKSIREVQCSFDKRGNGTITLYQKETSKLEPLENEINKCKSNHNSYMEAIFPNSKIWRRIYEISEVSKYKNLNCIEFKFSWAVDECYLKFPNFKDIVLATITFDKPQRQNAGVIKIQPSEKFPKFSKLLQAVKDLETIGNSTGSPVVQVTMSGKRDSDYTMRLYNLTEVEGTQSDESISLRFSFVDKKCSVRIGKKFHEGMIAHDKHNNPYSGIIRITESNKGKRSELLGTFKSDAGKEMIQVKIQDHKDYRALHGLTDQEDTGDGVSFRFTWLETSVIVNIPGLKKNVCAQVSWINSTTSRSYGVIQLWSSDLGITVQEFLNYSKRRISVIPGQSIEETYAFGVSLGLPFKTTEWRYMYVPTDKVNKGIYRGEEFLILEFSSIDHKIRLRINEATTGKGNSRIETASLKVGQRSTALSSFSIKPVDSTSTKQFKDSDANFVEATILYNDPKGNKRTGEICIWSSGVVDLNNIEKQLGEAFSPKRDYSFLELTSDVRVIGKKLKIYWVEDITRGTLWGKEFTRISFNTIGTTCLIRITGESVEVNARIFYDSFTEFSGGTIRITGNHDLDLAEYMDKLRRNHAQNPNLRDVHNYSYFKIEGAKSFEPIFGITYSEPQNSRAADAEMKFDRILPQGTIHWYWLKLGDSPIALAEVDIQKKHITIEKAAILKNSKLKNLKEIWRCIYNGDYDSVFQICGPTNSTRLPPNPYWQNVFNISKVKMTPRVEMGENLYFLPSYDPTVLEFDFAGTERAEFEHKFVISFMMNPTLPQTFKEKVLENIPEEKLVEVRLIGTVYTEASEVRVRSGYGPLVFLKSPVELKEHIYNSTELCPVGISNSFKSMEQFYSIPVRKTTIKSGSATIEEDIMGAVLIFKFEPLPTEETVILSNGEDGLRNKCLIRISDFVDGYFAVTIDETLKLVLMKDIYYDENRESGYFENTFCLSTIESAMVEESKKPGIWSYVDITGPWEMWPENLYLTAEEQAVQREEFVWKSLPGIHNLTRSKNGDALEILSFNYSHIVKKPTIEMTTEIPVHLIYIPGERYEIPLDKGSTYKYYIYGTFDEATRSIQILRSYGKLESPWSLGVISWMLSREIDFSRTGQRFVRVSEALTNMEQKKNLKWTDVYLTEAFAPNFENSFNGNPTLSFEVSRVPANPLQLEMSYLLVTGWAEPIIATVNRKAECEERAKGLWTRKIQVKKQFPNGIENTMDLNEIVQQIESEQKKYRERQNTGQKGYGADGVSDKIKQSNSTSNPARILHVSTKSWVKANSPAKDKLECLECQAVLDIESIIISADKTVLTITYGKISEEKANHKLW